MRADRSGIECSKEELAALLAFAGDDTNYGVVRFRIDAGGKLKVAASDGKRAVEHVATAEGAEPGEWAFDRTFIEALRRQTDRGETVAVIQADSRKAKAIFRGVESTAERAEIKCPVTAFSTQVSIDSIHDLVSGGKDNLTGSWFAFNPAHLSDLDKVSKAANGCPMSLLPPKEPDEYVRFKASSDRGTWRCCFKPTLVLAPGEEAESDPDDPSAPGSETQGLPSSAPPKLELTNELGASKKKKPKASKPEKAPRARKPKAAAGAESNEVA